ncbi:MAG: LysR family transcriptional regulator [Clostridiales bacterium]|nr:LysR family transcriptional regulator [Clostridiales bacterium]
MTLRHFKIFITVVDQKRVRKAAEVLFISQPAVSQAIAELEAHYQVKLFERISQRLYLTDMGEMLLPYARQAVDIFESTELMMKQKSRTHRLRIGASVTVGTTILHDILSKYEDRFGKLDVKVVVNNTQVIEEMICNSQLDIGIVEGNVESSDLIQSPVGEDELVFIVGKTHPLYHVDQINIEQLNGESLISREEGSVNRNQLEQHLLELNIHVKKTWSCTNSESIIQAVIAGRGIAIISVLLIQQELACGDVKILAVKDLRMKRVIHAIYHKDKFLSKPLQQLFEVMS